MHGEQYGRLVDFDVNAAHGWQQAGFPRAVITLLAQRMIAQMLRQVVDLLLADAESTGNTMWTAMVSKKSAKCPSGRALEFLLPSRLEAACKVRCGCDFGKEP